MPFWSGETLEKRMSALVTDYDARRIDCAAYTLRMGRQFYISASGPDVEKNKINQLL
jgi:hypothetical protein